MLFTLDCLSTFFTAQIREDIVVTMPDGSERNGKGWETSPMSIAQDVSKSLADRVVIAKVFVVCSTCSGCRD